MADKTLVLARPHIPKAETSIEDPNEAALDFASQLQGPALAGVLFFCASSYDLAGLGPAMKSAFSCPVLGCTTAGEIGLKYRQNSIVGIGLPASLFKMHVHAATPLSNFQDVLNKAPGSLSNKIDAERSFGLLFFDGQSHHRHQAVSLPRRFKTLKTVGAGAGNKGNEIASYVYCDGAFLRDQVVFTMLETSLPFQFFSFKYIIDKKSETMGKEDFLASLKNQINALRNEMPDILFTLGFESYLRRLLIEAYEVKNEAAHELVPLNFTGFNSNGEMNQDILHSETMTGVVFGAG